MNSASRTNCYKPCTYSEIPADIHNAPPEEQKKWVYKNCSVNGMQLFMAIYSPTDEGDAETLKKNLKRSIGKLEMSWLPPNIFEIMTQPCPLNQNDRVMDSHYLLSMPRQNITKDGSLVPIRRRHLLNEKKRRKTPHLKLLKFLTHQSNPSSIDSPTFIRWLSTRKLTSRWILIPKHISNDSTNKTLQEQEKWVENLPFNMHQYVLPLFRELSIVFVYQSIVIPPSSEDEDKGKQVFRTQDNHLSPTCHHEFLISKLSNQDSIESFFPVRYPFVQVEMSPSDCSSERIGVIPIIRLPLPDPISRQQQSRLYPPDLWEDTTPLGIYGND